MEKGETGYWPSKPKSFDARILGCHRVEAAAEKASCCVAWLFEEPGRSLLEAKALLRRIIESLSKMIHYL